jgi:predicted dehydrogenase
MGIVATPIRWGIMGTGWIAQTFVTDLQATGLTVSAVGSRTQDSATAFADAFNIPNAHPTYEDLVADPDVDVVYISTPQPFHAENAKLALNAGKHVLVEKPFTLNAAEALEVVELAESRGLIVLEAMWTRWLPHMVRVREILAAGTIGEVRTILADHDQHLPTDPSFRLQDPDLGGGALLDLGIYPVSFSWDVFGEPESIQAHSSATPTGVDRQTAIILGYPGGKQAVLHTALDTAGPNRAAVLGTEGRIEIDGVWYSATSFTVYDSANEVIERFDQPVVSRGMQYQAFEFERLIAEGLTVSEIMPPRQTVAIMGTLDAVRKIIGLVYPGGR